MRRSHGDRLLRGLVGGVTRPGQGFTVPEPQAGEDGETAYLPHSPVCAQKPPPIQPHAPVRRPAPGGFASSPPTRAGRRRPDTDARHFRRE